MRLDIFWREVPGYATSNILIIDFPFELFRHKILNSKFSNLLFTLVPKSSRSPLPTLYPSSSSCFQIFHSPPFLVVLSWSLPVTIGEEEETRRPAGIPSSIVDRIEERNILYCRLNRGKEGGGFLIANVAGYFFLLHKVEGEETTPFLFTG